MTAFGRPATTWVYDGDTVGTYGDEADDSIVLNKSIDAQKAIVTDSDYMNYSEDDVASKIAVYVNGDKQSATSYKALADLDLQAGDEIEVFMNDDNEIETIAVLRYSLAQIDEIETGLSSTYTKQGATCSITLQGLNETGSAAPIMTAMTTIPIRNWPVILPIMRKAPSWPWP